MYRELPSGSVMLWSSCDLSQLPSERLYKWFELSVA